MAGDHPRPSPGDRVRRLGLVGVYPRCLVSSDTPQQPMQRSRIGERQVTIPVALIASMVSAMAAGGLGSGLTGSSVSAELREFRVEVRAQLGELQRELSRQAQDHHAALERLERAGADRETRLRALELWRAEEKVRTSLMPPLPR